ncbi:efflux RND transporter periplasmic adaptor subunit [Methylobacterium sp. Leaf93]|uniref:efflux RND transporter periplasmic adaptor subunit n=1 Tax=Methylobacterium sp. Leaf93 TaxID=1736249 RepID=UPI0006F362FB|nr:efflux RND transporter periplasmic adaptor subunit [Methylobacterium sp. Leaf93]KQP00975.1 hypothetical protein ASF26_15520 [Methylobacterium sp. Leaf93]
MAYSDFAKRCGVIALLVLSAASIFSKSEAMAQGTQDSASVPSARSVQACVSEQVRITGFALAREEGGAGIVMEGYRISQILVSEGDAVTSGQEVLRAVPLNGEDASSGRPATINARASIAGIVTRINARVGMVTGTASTPGPGGQPEPQIRIAANSGIDLLVDVPSPYATKIRAGTAARILIADANEVKGVVRVAVSEVDPVTQLGRARLTIDPASALRPGQFASAVIETSRVCGVSVPRSAVLRQSGVTSVQVVNGSKVETRRVKIDLADDNTVVVREGLAEGEAVIVDAGAAFRTGDRVTPVLIGVDGTRNR